MGEVTAETLYYGLLLMQPWPVYGRSHRWDIVLWTVANAALASIWEKSPLRHCIMDLTIRKDNTNSCAPSQDMEEVATKEFS